MTLTTEAATLMKEKLRTLTMQDFAGEDIHKAATVIRGTHKRLEMINGVPSDLPQWIINIFLTCSVPQFVQIFTTIQSLHSLRGLTGGVVYDVPTLIEVAELTYVKLSTVWTVAPNTTSSTFLGRHNRQVTCWGCGKVGHSLDKCPTTSDADKSEIFESKRGGRNNNNNGNANLSQPANPTNNGNGGNSGSRVADPNSIRSQSKVPPKDGESHTRVIGGKERKWCATCKWWNYTHLTAQHDSSKRKNGGGNNSGNVNTVGNNNTQHTGGLNFAQQISQQLSQGRN